MSASLSPTRIFKCDGCQATLPYDPSRAGQKCRCGQCGKILIVPAAENIEPPPPAPPAYIEFWCHVCDTRLVARGTDAGRKAKCFECGAINRVPVPKPKEKPREPPAMHGQQYGIWEVNKAPDPEDLLAVQPKLFPVYCRVCDTLMYAQPKHVGGKLKCPDCGALTTVKEPPKQPEKKSVLVPAGQEYQLDPAQAITTSAVPEYVERLTRISKIAVEEQAKREAAERPPMPRFPTFVGVLPMLVNEPIPVWGVALSAAGMGVAFLAIEAATTPIAGLQAIYAMLCTVLAFLFGILWFAPLASVSCAIVAESSEGLKKLHSYPSIFVTNCFLEVAHIVFPLSLSLAPGFALMRFTPWQIWTATAAASWIVLFPVLLLSTFQHNTPMGIFSARIWSSLVLRPAHWLVFYIQSAIIVGVVGVTILQLAVSAPEWILFSVVIALAGWFVYVRVLGRFAWWLAESLPEKDEPRPEPRYKRF